MSDRNARDIANTVLMKMAAKEEKPSLDADDVLDIAGTGAASLGVLGAGRHVLLHGALIPTMHMGKSVESAPLVKDLAKVMGGGDYPIRPGTEMDAGFARVKVDPTVAKDLKAKLDYMKKDIANTSPGRMRDFKQGVYDKAKAAVKERGSNYYILPEKANPFTVAHEVGHGSAKKHFLDRMNRPHILKGLRGAGVLSLGKGLYDTTKGEDSNVAFSAAPVLIGASYVPQMGEETRATVKGIKALKKLKVGGKALPLQGVAQVLGYASLAGIPLGASLITSGLAKHRLEQRRKNNA